MPYALLQVTKLDAAYFLAGITAFTIGVRLGYVSVLRPIRFDDAQRKLR